MARINIEDELQEDPRFHMLEETVGKIMALGIVAHGIKMAQFYWTKKDAPRSLIPKKLFLRNIEMQNLIECELAIEKEEGFIYIRGSEEKFAWIEQKREAGKKSGELRKNKSNGIERVLNENAKSLNEIEPLTLTPTLAPIPTLNKKEKEDVTPDDIIELFNTLLANKGRITSFNFHSMPRTVLEDFILTSGFPEFRKKEQWIKYFKIVASRKKLLSFPATISFLVKHSSAVEILSGGYQDKEESASVNSKTTPNNQARDMAANIYTQVLRNGMHQLKETLQALDPLETQALQKFGMASEIINCPSDFAATDIKNRLKNACEEVLKDQRQVG